MENRVKFERPIKIADGVFWVGVFEPDTSLHCNPFLIVDDGHAVVIDGGSRPDFTGVMMKILQCGIHPHQIEALICQHYDPDLCGSLPNFVELCGNPGLKIISGRIGRTFVCHYLERSKHELVRDITTFGHSLTVGARTLRFIETPFAHSSDSFTTYDEATKTLFTSDLFGSMSHQWRPFLDLTEECYTCPDFEKCPNHADYCPIPDIVRFHQTIMPCEKALRYAMTTIAKLDVAILAPQHGSISRNRKEIAFLIETLAKARGVGIDHPDFA